MLKHETVVNAHTPCLSDKEYLLHFKKKVEKLRVPLTGDIAITHRCNLRCLHCYLGSERKNLKISRKELSTSQFLSTLDDITEAGCLFLLITGGEPLLRDDFIEIYRHAKTNGLLVTVFTNGTLITDKVLEVFEHLPPLVVEISLYGATATTYEKITGVKGSYRQCLNGIERLLEHQINVRLKTVLMSLNHNEFLDIQAMAKQFGVKFRMDAEIFPRFNGDKTPLELRVAPEEAVEKEFLDKDRLMQWEKLFKRLQEVPAQDTLYSCGAGVTHFHVDPFGNLKPCMMMHSPRYNLSRGNFLSGWRYVLPQIRKKKAKPSFACNHCEKRSLCNYCPAFFALENQAEDTKSEYLCSIGQLRFQEIAKGTKG